MPNLNSNKHYKNNVIRSAYNYKALQVLRFASQFVILFPSPSCIRAATYVLKATSFISSSVTLHYTSFAATICCKSWHTILAQVKAQVMHFPLRKAFATILTGFHSAALCPAFISVAFSPSAACNCTFSHMYKAIEAYILNGFYFF